MQIKAIVATAFLALCFGAGWAVNGWRLTSHTAKAEVKAVEHVAAVEHSRAVATAAVEASAAAAEVQTQIVYRNINHEVIRYVQSPAPACTLDADFVRLYNSAATGQPVPDSSGAGNGASAPGAGNAPHANGDDKGGFTGDGGQLPDISTRAPTA